MNVVVTDIGLPGEDGYSLLRRIRALPGGSQLTAIALTAYATQQDSQRAMDAGFERHLSKPIDPLYLVKVLAELSSSRSTPVVIRGAPAAVAASPAS